MIIVNRDELAKFPDGTVFMLYEPINLSGDIHIKTGTYDWNGKPTWNGELLLTPFLDVEESDNGTRDFSTEWITTDNSECDYEEDQLFAVFSKTEIRKIIDCLAWALTDCKTDFNQDEYFWHDMRVQRKD